MFTRSLTTVVKVNACSFIGFWHFCWFWWFCSLEQWAASLSTFVSSQRWSRLENCGFSAFHSTKSKVYSIKPNPHSFKFKFKCKRIDNLLDVSLQEMGGIYHLHHNRMQLTPQNAFQECLNHKLKTDETCEMAEVRHWPATITARGHPAPPTPIICIGNIAMQQSIFIESH